MLTAALILLCLLLLVALGVVVLFWRAAVLHVTDQARLIRHQCERIAGYRAELDALSIGPPPAARAALTPDDPALPLSYIEQIELYLELHAHEEN